MIQTTSIKSRSMQCSPPVCQHQSACQGSQKNWDTIVTHTIIKLSRIQLLQLNPDPCNAHHQSANITLHAEGLKRIEYFAMCTTSKLARNQNTSIVSKPIHAHWEADIKQVDKSAQHGEVVKFWGKDRFWSIGQLERTIVSLPSASWIWASRLLPPVPPGMTTSPWVALLSSSSISTASRIFSLSTNLISSTISLNFSAGSIIEFKICLILPECFPPLLWPFENQHPQQQTWGINLNFFNSNTADTCRHAHHREEAQMQPKGSKLLPRQSRGLRRVEQ